MANNEGIRLRFLVLRVLLGTVVAIVFVLMALTSIAEAHTASWSATCGQVTLKLAAFASSGSGNGGKNKVHYQFLFEGQTYSGVVTFTTSQKTVVVTIPMDNGLVDNAKAWWYKTETRDGSSNSGTALDISITSCLDTAPPPPPPPDDDGTTLPPSETGGSTPPGDGGGTTTPPSNTPPSSTIATVPISFVDSDVVRHSAGSVRSKRTSSKKSKRAARHVAPSCVVRTHRGSRPVKSKSCKRKIQTSPRFAG